ncbi:Transformer-2 protein-like protein beta [Sarcoptes scabiei]|nr:Transformer-2 protein-like protein beta [Sarcoptes scabiei]
MLNIFSDGDKGEILGNGNTKPSIKQGMDPFKYLCCWKAQTQQCRTLCFDTYSTEFSESFHSFEMRCLRNSFEQDLIGCFEDSDGHQCQHRCQSKSLEFCRVFEKITLPLRNCRSDSDLEAQNLFSWWKESGVIDKSIQLASSLSNNKIIDGIVERKKFQREIRGRNFDHLEHFWRLLACQIKLRPCSKKTHRTLSSCHRNCRKLLGLISDKTKVIFTQSKIKQKYQSIQNDTSLDDDFIICDLLQSLIEQTLSGSMESVRFSSTINVGSLFNENDDKCLDFDEFFQNKTSIQTFSSKKNDEEWGLKESKQICSTNYDCFVSDCPRRRCKNFCTLGKLQQFRIVGENHINLPVIFNDNNDIFNRNGQCFHRCYCNRDGHLVDCHYRSMCPLRNSTQILVWKKSIHQQIKCMFECSRETKKSPLCIKGLMYYNRCYGKCFKSDDELQSFMIDSDQECQTTPIEDDRFVWMDCLRDSSDMKSSQKCYFSSIAHLDERNEDLYQRIKIKLFDLCLNSTTSLHREDFILRSLIRKLPICDDLGGQFESICHFYRKIIQSDRKSYNASISYFGRCRLYCSLSGPVCGRDQRTYRSECAAQSNQILVDYFGECHKENRHCPRLPVHHRCPPEFLQFNTVQSLFNLCIDRLSSLRSTIFERIG